MKNLPGLFLGPGPILCHCLLRLAGVGLLLTVSLQMVGEGSLEQEPDLEHYH